MIYHRLVSSFSDRWRLISDETIFDQSNDLQATLYGEYRRIMEEEGEAKDDGRKQVDGAIDQECVVFPMQGASQGSSRAFPRTQKGCGR